MQQDLTGKRFGNLTVIKKSGANAHRSMLWKCKCDCGKTTLAPTGQLNFGKRVSCGCGIGRSLVGKRFGKLVVQGLSKVRSSDNFRLWNCLCDCGNKTRVRTASLNNGNTKSCGCLKINNLTGINNYQAQRALREHGVWVSSDSEWYVRGCQMWGRIKKEKIPTDFKSAAEIAVYLKEITPKKCPVFGVPLTKGDKTTHKWSPSADRIHPDKGYKKGNIQVISQFANIMKQNATPKELKQFAKWVLREAA